jgi:hypothetical protein
MRFWDAPDDRLRKELGDFGITQGSTSLNTQKQTQQQVNFENSRENGK